ncbi:MAG: metal-dependent hydrolase [Promethearchaeota archaeon]
MNTLTHFLTGYLIGRGAFRDRGFKNDYIIPFFAAMVAVLPDLDAFIYSVTGWELFYHAVFTHTIIGALLFTAIFTLIIWAIGAPLFKKLQINFGFLCIVALAGISSHLILDIFTYREEIYTTNAHLYFWPICNVSFHLNFFFPRSMYPNIYFVRILIEVIYTAFLVILIIIYGWFIKKENPFAMFFPHNWLEYIEEKPIDKALKTRALLILIFSLSLLIMMFTSIFNYLF